VDPAGLGRTLGSAATASRAASLTDLDLTNARLDASRVLAVFPDLRREPRYVRTDLCVGLWQHCVGTSTDVEADEMVVVHCGHAAAGIEDSPPIHGGPGEAGVLTTGARTRRTLHVTLRRVYVVRP